MGMMLRLYGWMCEFESESFSWVAFDYMGIRWQFMHSEGCEDVSDSVGNIQGMQLVSGCEDDN